MPRYIAALEKIGKDRPVFFANTEYRRLVLLKKARVSDACEPSSNSARTIEMPFTEWRRELDSAQAWRSD